MKKIMFVCTGNTCRSAMCQCIMRKLIRDGEIKGLEVSSSGISVTESSINQMSKKALKEIGVRAGKFTPKQVSKELVLEQDAVICMTEAQKNAFVGFDNVYSINQLTGVGDVVDPYGKGIEVYVETALILKKACDKLIKILKDENLL